ncbi:MAG: hypothetical protein ACYTGC_06040 [Planctomycetota bacterium]|jgi:hypothetical protein
MKRSSVVIVERTVAGITLGVAFLIMASIIVPEDSGATERGHAPATGSITPDESHAGVSDSHVLPSTDPHEGLRQLGSIEGAGYLVCIFATQTGPRYSIYDAESEAELATLMTAEQVSEHFPDLPLDRLEISPPGLMLAEPTSSPW